jgi:signal peptidase I
MIKLFIGGLLAAVYLVINLVMPHIPMDILIRTYVLQPFLWGMLIVAIRFLPGQESPGKLSLRGSIIRVALMIGLIQVLFYFIGGLFSNFGKNPSSQTLMGVIENLFFVGLMLLAMEIGRARLVAGSGKRGTFLVLTVTALLFTLISIPLNQFTHFKLQIESTNLVISTWVPLLLENLMATFLAMMAGARASLAYRAPMAAFWWFCPILPNLNWSFKGIIGVGVPVFGMVILNSLYSLKISRGKSRKRLKENAFPTAWVATALAGLVIVWFAVGVFPFKPSVIPTGSMEPVISPGDLVIVARVPPEAIKLGDIIEYRNVKDNVNIVHRVIKILAGEKENTFITKGDNNNLPDIDPVLSQNVMGKMVLDIPRIGMISLVVKKILTGAGPQ